MFFSGQFFYILAFLQLVYLYGYIFSKGKNHIHTLNTVIIKYLCLASDRAFAKNHKAVKCDCCDRWFHIACNYLNVYTYRKLQKDKSPWYCLCCLKKEMPFCFLKNEHLRELMHGKIILSPNKKIVMNAIRQNKIIDDELLRKANSKFVASSEFNHALKDLVNIKYALHMYLNILSLLYNHQQLYNILCNMKSKPKS